MSQLYKKRDTNLFSDKHVLFCYHNKHLMDPKKWACICQGWGLLSPWTSKNSMFLTFFEKKSGIWLFFRGGLLLRTVFRKKCGSHYILLQCKLLKSSQESCKRTSSMVECWLGESFARYSQRIENASAVDPKK